MVNDFADVTSSGRSFHVCGPVTGKARLPTVDSLLVGTTRRLLPTERSDHQPVRSATRVKEPRYPGASPTCQCLVGQPWLTLKVCCVCWVCRCVTLKVCRVCRCVQ